MFYTLIVIVLTLSGQQYYKVVDTHITKEQCLIQAGSISSKIEEEHENTKMVYLSGLEPPEDSIVGGDVYCNKMLSSAEEDLNLIRNSYTQYGEVK